MRSVSPAVAYRMVYRLMVLLGLYFILLPSAPAYGQAKVKVVAVITGGDMIGSLKDPSGLFFDYGKKRLYISDSGNKRLLSFSFDSEVKFHAEFTHKDLGTPWGIVKDREGYFYTVDSESGKVLFVNPAEDVVEPIDLGEAMPGRIAIDGDGRLYVVDRLKKRLFVVGMDRKVEREIVLDMNLSGINDLRVDGEGRIYLLDTIERRVHILSPEGRPLSSFSSGEFLFPTSIAVSDRGLIYITDGHRGRVLVFNMDGQIQYTFARKGAMVGELYHPSYIVVDRDGRIYVVDGNRIQIFQELVGR